MHSGSVSWCLFFSGVGGICGKFAFCVRGFAHFLVGARSPRQVRVPNRFEAQWDGFFHSGIPRQLLFPECTDITCGSSSNMGCFNASDLY